MTWMINPYRWGPVGIPAPASVDWGFLSLCSSFTAGVIGDLQFYDAPGGTVISSGGTARARRTTFNPTDTFNPDTFMFDFSTSTARTCDGDDRMIAAYQMPAPNIVREVWLSSEVSALGLRAPLGFVVMVSRDGRLTWEPCALFNTPSPWVANTTRVFTFDPFLWIGGTGRLQALAWRVLINAWPSGANPRIGDIAFAASLGGPTLCTGGSAISGPGTGFGQVPELAFDGNVATYWNGVGTGLLGQRVGYGWSSPRTVRELRLQAPSSGFNSMPTSFDVQWSLNFLDWTTALSVVGDPAWSASEIRSYAIP